MIYDAATLDTPLVLKADLCVVGSGPGGATAAMVAAEAGLDVILLEAGSFVPPSRMTQREERMLPELLWANGGRTSRDKAVHIHQGRGVGGSSLHNINLCKRIPDVLLREWNLEHLPVERWHALYEEVEELLQVSAVPEAAWSVHNRMLQRAVEAKGWRGGGLQHNRTGCVGSGFCLLGCAWDAKSNALKVCIPRLVAAGGRVLTHAQAVRVQHDGQRVLAVEGRVLDPITRQPVGDFVVEAQRVALAASATGTPALMLRSSLPGPEVGEGLRIHPAVAAAGDFDEAIEGWRGIPQTYECTEFLDLAAVHGPGSDPTAIGKRTWIVTAFAQPVGTATMLPGFGSAHLQQMGRYPHLGVLTAMIHDLTPGRVRPRGELGVSLDYWPDPLDRRELLFGLERCCELLFTAGARRVYIPTDPITEIERGQAFPFDELHRYDLDLTAVHPMASVPMEGGAVDSRGQHLHLEGLWISDGSLFPSSIGMPPQLSIYAMGLHVGRALVAAG